MFSLKTLQKSKVKKIKYNNYSFIGQNETDR